MGSCRGDLCILQALPRTWPALLQARAGFPPCDARNLHISGFSTSRGVGGLQMQVSTTTKNCPSSSLMLYDT